jgi:hypothetical protein
MKSIRLSLIILTLAGIFFLPFTACNSKKSAVIKIDSTQIKLETDLTNKYVMIYETLDHYFKSITIKNTQIVEALDEKKDVTIAKRLKTLRRKAQFTNKKLSLAKVFLYTNIGGEYDEIAYSVKKPLEVARVEAYLINLDKKGEAYELERVLNEYVDYLNEEFKDVNSKGFISMTHLPKDNPMLKPFPELQKRDFVESKFRGASVVLAMAILTQLQNQVLIYENQIIEALVKK